MRIRKNKKNRKTMQYYEINYGFKSPYKVILEESFIREGLKLQLPNTFEDLIHTALLDNSAELVITDCIRKRFELFKDKNMDEFKFIETLRCVKCGHREDISSIKCVMDIAKNMRAAKEKYVICSQKDLYKTDLRRIPGVPLIYFNRSVLTLDTPSKNTQHSSDAVNESKLDMKVEERISLGLKPDIAHIHHFNRKLIPTTPIKRPSPLSCKKKIKKFVPEKKEGKKTRRKNKKEKESPKANSSE